MKNPGAEIETPFLPSERHAWIELKTGFSVECCLLLFAIVAAPANLRVGLEIAVCCCCSDQLNSPAMVIFLRTEEYRSGPFRVSCMNTTFPNFLSFSRPSKDPSPTSAAYYEALLRNISPEDIESGNANPILYVVPYARLLALRFSRSLKGLRDDIRVEEEYADSVEGMSAMSHSLKDLNNGLEVSIASLRDILHYPPRTGSSLGTTKTFSTIRSRRCSTLGAY
jgi:hypothetical protein